MMRRWLPHPVTSLLLAIVWLLLNQSASAGNFVLGVLFAVTIPLVLAPLRPVRLRLRKPGVALRLLGVFLYDVVMSNIEVARRVLGPEAAIRPGFVWIPLKLTEPHAIATLAAIITLTPGTLSADLTEDRRHLLVHAFNVDEPEALIAGIKNRYERPLLEIFE
jgi:multicomponent K+:H+ antiporter subunit E